MVKGKIVLLLALLLISTSSWAQTAGDMLNRHSYPGVIQASRTAKLAFRVGGPLVEVKVKAGQRVTQGGLLMQIDRRDFVDKIEVLEAQLAGARAQRQLAKRNFNRAETLFEQQVAASADFDQAKSRFDSARAGVRGLEAQLKIARHQLADTSLKAPYDAVVSAQMVENHEMVKPGQVVLSIQNIDQLEVEIQVPESEIMHYPLKRGQPARVELLAADGLSIQAELQEWSPIADPVTRTYTLRFAFPVPPGVQVLPGMTAEVTLPPTTSTPSSRRARPPVSDRLAAAD